MEDPGTIGACLADRHLPGRDTPLRRMFSSHGVLVEASTNCCGEYLAIAIAQRQRALAFAVISRSFHYCRRWRTLE